MANIQTNSNQSPFDSIRHIDEHGNEYWCARELMTMLGYSRWADFKSAVERAKLSHINQNGSNNVVAHFSGATVKNSGQVKVFALRLTNRRIV